MKVRDRYIQELKRLAETSHRKGASGETKRQATDAQTAELRGDISGDAESKSVEAQIAELQGKIENAKRRLASSGAKLKAFEEKQIEV